MRFAIKQAGCNSERIGCLSGFAKLTSAHIETPTTALHTQGASVVHLTAEVLSKVYSDPQILWIPLSNSIHLESGLKAQREGVAKFAGLPEHLTCATSNSSIEVTPAGHFELDKIPLWTKNGKKLITADRYMDLMELFKPDMILAIADGRTSLNEGYKRLKKSVERTCAMLSVCVKRYGESKQLKNSSIIGVIVGAGDEKKCDECIANILVHRNSISGVALSSLTDGTEESLNVPIEKLVEIFKRIGRHSKKTTLSSWRDLSSRFDATLLLAAQTLRSITTERQPFGWTHNAIPKDLVRIVEGCWNPAVVVSAIQQGWDLFDGSYPLHLTNKGLALALNFDVNRNSDDLCIMDMNSDRYKEDFGPVLANCECLACKKHTRAYIRHLLNTREMLASVLLSIHNLHHFDQMFHHARRHIASNTFQVYKEHIIEQYEMYKKNCNVCDNEKPNETVNRDSEVKNTQVKKKIRVSDKVPIEVNGVNNSASQKT